MSDLFGVGGQQLLADATRLAVESRSRVDSLLRLITALDFEIELFAKLVTGRLRTDPGYRAIQQIPGVGPVLAAVFVAEIGDITRFARPEQLASLGRADPETPRVRHHRAPRPDHQAGLPAGALGRGRGRATRARPHPARADPRPGRATRRGRNIGVVAAARELITLVFYGLRDHHIRCLPAADHHRRGVSRPQNRGGRGSCRS